MVMIYSKYHMVTIRICYRHTYMMKLIWSKFHHSFRMAVCLVKFDNYMIKWVQMTKVQKQPSRGVFKKRCSEDMQHIYRRTPMPKSNFNKVAMQLFSRTPLKGCFWNFLKLCVENWYFLLKKYLFWTKASMSLNKESSSYSDLFC